MFRVEVKPLACWQQALYFQLPAMRYASSLLCQQSIHGDQSMLPAWQEGTWYVVVM
jgi:hypothetical protein